MQVQALGCEGNLPRAAQEAYPDTLACILKVWLARHKAGLNHMILLCAADYKISHKVLRLQVALLEHFAAAPGTLLAPAPTCLLLFTCSDAPQVLLLAAFNFCHLVTDPHSRHGHAVQRAVHGLPVVDLSQQLLGLHANLAGLPTMAGEPMCLDFWYLQS